LSKVKELKDYIYDDELDLDRIVDDFSPYVRTIINNMVNNNLTYEDKEEILSDTFFILWKNRYNYILSLDKYIAGIARNLVKEKLRKIKITYDISNYENDIEYSNIEIYSEEREDIKRCLDKLNDVEQQIFNMFYYSSKSVKDIAKELNISEFNVTTRLYRIRKKLRKELEIGG
jgi:RNA polymerase sigma-70 factor (ECF subfamily)